MKTLGLILFSTLVCLAVILIACKKNANSTPSNISCKITTVLCSKRTVYSSLSDTAYHLSYDSLGRVINVSAKNNNIDVYYFTDLILRVNTPNGQSSHIDTIVILSNRVDSFLSHYWNYYFYNNAGSVDSIIYGFTPYPIEVYCFNWQNGDLVKEYTKTPAGNYTPNPDSSIFHYYSDKNYMEGDFLQVLSLLQQDGTRYMPYGTKNSHLIKELRDYDGGEDEIFVYTFDTEGKITNINGSSGGQIVNNITLQYTCK